jgi:DNA-binding LacI/PurR family transcriptional regulator
LRDAGCRVPEDVAIVGFDDSAAATMVEPALTTMRNPIEQTALKALEILDDQIAGRLHQPVHVLLNSELVERGSA